MTTHCPKHNYPMVNDYNGLKCGHCENDKILKGNNMTQPNHTPTPWSIDGYNLTGVLAKPIFTKDFGKIYPKVCDCSSKSLSIGEQLANAKHIVKCVNCHDELLSALKNAKSELEIYHDSLQGDNEAQDEIYVVIREIEVALSKAEREN